MFTQTSAATAAPSRTAALPVSVVRNSRSGVCRLRAHAVVPENVGRPSRLPLVLNAEASIREERFQALALLVELALRRA